MKLQYSAASDRYYVEDLTGWKTEFHCGDCVKVFINNPEEKNGLWFRFEFEFTKKYWYLYNEKENIIFFAPFSDIESVELK